MSGKVDQSFKTWVRVPTGVGGAMQDEKVGDVSVVIDETPRKKPCVVLSPSEGGPIWAAQIDARQMDALCRRWMQIRSKEDPC